MYYPFLRGKQFELILLRDNTAFLKSNNIHPVIEPVKKSSTALLKAASALVKEGVEHTLIVNPQVGEYSKEQIIPDDLLNELLKNNKVISLGFILHPESKISDLNRFLSAQNDCDISLIHYGFTNGRDLVKAIDGEGRIRRHIFIDEQTSKLYQKQFRQDGVQRILIRDGFRLQKKNAHYPPSEHFSDLHITYPDEGMDGFGDFLIVGDEFRESGGPAYAVAIHLTYIDNEKDDDMFIYHFISDQTDSPTNPGGKFLEALQKLVNEVKKPDSKILKSNAIDEYLKLYDHKHFPGLGYVKKLSMQHHVELIADYLRGAD